MNTREKKWKKLVCGLAFVLAACMNASVGWTAADMISRETAAAVQMEEDTVLVGGMPIGIYMETDGVLVLDTQEVTGMDGQVYEPAHNLVKAGDYIVGINDAQITDKEELIQSVGHLETKEVVLNIRRNTDRIDVKLDAVESEPGKYKLGIWVKDNIQGLGTITFLNENSEFGALGHGIHDTDTGVLLNIAGGKVYKTSIRSVIKGQNGVPGSLEGLIVYNHYNRLGNITKNTETGIYGELEDLQTLFKEQIAVQVADMEEVKKGPAMIRCYIQNEVKEYEVQILEVNVSAHESNKGIVLQVTDEELLKETGGIVQGMSGSPILQNGKLVGAVTHVFVNDPTKGYGIFAEIMINETAD